METLFHIIDAPGIGGLIVLGVLVLCILFYGSLVTWIARVEKAPKLEEARRPEHARRREEPAIFSPRQARR